MKLRALRYGWILGVSLATTLSATSATAAEKPLFLGPPGLMADDIPLFYSHDGKRLITRKAAIYDDYMYAMWDVATNRKLREFRQPKNDRSNLTSGGPVAISYDGTRLGGGFASSVFLWDTANAKVLMHYTTNSPRGLRGVAFSPDGKTMIAMAENPREIMTVHVFDVKTAKKTGDFQAPNTHLPVVFHPNNQSIFALTKSGDVQRYSITGKLLKTFKGPIVAFALTAGARNLVAVDRKGTTLATFSVGTGKLTRRLPGPGGPISGISFSENGRVLATAVKAGLPGDKSSTVTLRDVQTGRVLKSIASPSYGATISPDAKIVISGRQYFNTATGKEFHEYNGPDDGVVAVAYTPGGKLLSLTRTGDFCTWNTVNGKLESRLKKSGARFGRMTVVPTGDAVISGFGEKIDLKTGKSERLTHMSGLAPGYSPDGKQVAVAGRLIDVATGKVIRPLFAPGIPSGYGVHVFSPDGKTIASASQFRGDIVLNDAATGKEIRKFVGHKRGAYVIAFTPDGKHLVSTSCDSFVKGDMSVRVWDVATGKERHRFTGLKTSASQNSGLSPLAISPDGKLVASAFHDHIVRVWDVATGKTVHEFRGHDREVTSVSFSPDGRQLASGSLDATIRVWPVGKK